MRNRAIALALAVAAAGAIVAPGASAKRSCPMTPPDGAGYYKLTVSGVPCSTGYRLYYNLTEGNGAYGISQDGRSFRVKVHPFLMAAAEPFRLGQDGTLEVELNAWIAAGHGLGLAW